MPRPLRRGSSPTRHPGRCSVDWSQGCRNRDGVVEHFNEVWDKSFFRTEVFAGLDHLSADNDAFIQFHNRYHRYAAHGGASPAEIWRDRLRFLLELDYRPPTQLPPEADRSRPLRPIQPSGRPVRKAHHRGRTPHPPVRHSHHQGAHQEVLVVTLDGEIVQGDYPIARVLSSADFSSRASGDTQLGWARASSTGET